MSDTKRVGQLDYGVWTWRESPKGTLKGSDGKPLEVAELLDLLLELKEYIENAEYACGTDVWSPIRTFEDIYEDGDAPEVYDTICDIISANDETMGAATDRSKHGGQP